MTTVKFNPGSPVRIRMDDPPIHHRTPWYVKGKTGRVDAVYDPWPNPEEMAYGRTDKPPVRLYRIEFEQPHLWNDYTGPQSDKLVIDIFEHWLEPAEESER
jgi:nitrile hydratase subunit beta